ncbi:MAG: glycoside hydrolase family 2 protein [Solirubrobacteraceae bacterium]
MRPRRFIALGALLLPAVLAFVLLGAAPSSSAPAATPLTHAGPIGRVPLTAWVLRGDRENVGIARGWGAGRWTGRSVTVPFSPNADPKRLSGDRGEANFQGSIAWYRSTFEVPRAGRYAIDFQSVNHRATVWIDGERIGLSHEGEFQPFAKHFTASGPGRHTVVVRADYTDIERQNATGWHRTWFNFGGINREVTVRPVGRSDISEPGVFTTLGASSGDAVVRVRARLHNRAARRSIELTGTLAGQALDFPRVTVPAGESRLVEARVRIHDPKLWAPDTPTLHDLVLTVPGEAQWSGRVGLRQITWRGRDIFINGHRLHLHGASLHEDAYGRGNALTAADMDGLVGELEEVGANVTRAHHPLSPALLERLDAAGILVYQEVGPNDPPGGFSLKTPELRREGRRRIRVTIGQLQIHPSIFAWTLANEAAGRGHNDGQRPFVDHVAQELHRIDPGRMVGVDLWGTYVPDSDRGLQMYRHLDVIGLTNYDGWYNDNAARGARLRRIIQDSVDEFATAFPDKVLMLSEFGAEANPYNPTDSAGGYDFQTRLLQEHLRVYEADRRIAGMMIWVLRDFAVTPAFAGGSIRREVPSIRLVRGIAQKGLFDYRGRPKPAAAVIGRIFRSWPDYR